MTRHFELDCSGIVFRVRCEYEALLRRIRPRSTYVIYVSGAHRRAVTWIHISSLNLVSSFLKLVQLIVDKYFQLV